VLLPEQSLLAGSQVVARFAEAIDPVLQPKASQIRIEASGTWLRLQHREMEWLSGGAFGPKPGSFVLAAHVIRSITEFDLSEQPFDWEGFPKRPSYPWRSEFHLLPLAPSRWLAVSV
jgi:hypothetical protein